MEDSSFRVGVSDLREYLGVIWRRKWFVILPVVIITTAVITATSLFITPQYASTAELLQRRSGLDKALLGSDLFQQSYSPERAMQTAAELVKSPQVVSAVTKSIGDRLDDRDPSSMVSVRVIKQSDILRLTVTDADAQLASDVANSFATEYINWRRGVDQEVLQQARLPIQEQISSTPPELQESANYKVLKDKLETLKMLESLQTGDMEVVKQATAVASPVSPKPIQTGLISFIASVAFGVSIVFVAEHLDTKVRSTDEISRALQKPVLAAVPKINASTNRSLITIANPSGACSESFRLLKTNLSYIEPDREIKSIMITSAQPGEGKTTTIANLAVTMARAGQRVIILDGDMRRPMLHHYMKLDNTVGLTNVIAGNCTLRESLQMIDTEDLAISLEGEMRDTAVMSGFAAPSMNGVKPIYCATVGPLPPNPGELTSSEKFSSLIVEASQYADIVLVDAPPLGAVGDAASMASKVDGVVVIVRLAETSKKSLGLISHFIETVPTHVMGVVVTNASADGSGYGYKGSYYYGDRSNLPAD
ncbi:MAG: tyrosine-protein kinase domain-containing protein [Thermoleophilia bacterium]